ncbi:MAG: DUF6276 family protein [Halobacteriaceae archaeon]
MSCPDCGASVVAFTLPDALDGVLPDDRPAAALCTRCLRVAPLESPPTAPPAFGAVSDAFPADPEAGAAAAAMLALLDSPGLYRAELRALVEYLEVAGDDPFLLLSRLADDPDLDPAVDLSRRSRQLEQLL